MSHNHSIEDGFPNLEEIEDMKEMQTRPGLSSTMTASSSIPHVKREVVSSQCPMALANMCRSSITCVHWGRLRA